MTKQSEKLLKEWVSRLGLSDWRIKLRDNMNPEDMTLSDVSGCTTWNESIKCAFIEIVNPSYYGNRIVPFDYEKTLVHELLHIKTSFLTDGVGELQERVGHQMIDDLARALVDAKRSGGANGDHNN